MKRLLILGLVLAACSNSKTESTTGAAPLPTAATAEAELTLEHRHGAPSPVVDDFKMTILSDMVPGRRTAGEWGFSALLEVTAGGVTKRFLFDTGGAPQTVIFNAGKLNVDLCSIEDVILSHNHGDHTLGLNTLRSTCKASNPNAFKNAYIGGEEIFWPRPTSTGGNDNVMTAEKVTYEAQGGTFIVGSTATTFLMPGMWLTGKIDRKFDEKTYPGTPNIKDPDGNLSSDLIPEEHALVINTPSGLLVLTGCAHAGIINTVRQARHLVHGHHDVWVAGGVHLFQRPLGDESTEGTVRWVGGKMAQLGVTKLLGAHCTGLERLPFLRDYLGIDQTDAVFSSVGTTFSATGGFTFTNPAINTLLQ